MPINIDIVEQKFFNDLHNGSLFDQDLSVFATHLKGPIMGRRKVETTIDVNWYLESTDWSIFESNPLGSPRTLKIRVKDGSWLSEGFSDGDIIDFEANTPGTERIFQGEIIQIISSDTIFVNVNGASLNFPPNGNYSSNLVVRGLTPQLGLKLPFLINENSENVLNSKLDGSSSAYYWENIGPVISIDYSNVLDPIITRNTDEVDGIWNGIIKSGKTGISKAQFIEYKDDSGLQIASTRAVKSIQQYVITHEFTIIPYYREGEDENLLTSIGPSDLFANEKSVKYQIEPLFANSVSDPNSYKSSDPLNQLGAVSYFDEVFNGQNKAYELEEVIRLDDLGNPVETLVIGQSIEYNIKIRTLNGNPFNIPANSAELVARFSKLPTQEEYFESEEEFDLVWVYDSLRQNQGDPGVSSNGIKEFTAVEDGLDPDVLNIVFKIDLSNDQIARFENGDSYLIALELNNKNKDSADISTPQVLVVDTGAVEVDVDIPGLIGNQNIRIYDHAKDFTGIINDGYRNGYLWIEDGFTTVFDFIAKIDQSPVIENINIKYVGYNNTTGQSFDIDDVNVSLGDNTLGPNGEQVLNSETTRGFNLSNDSQFNKVKLTSFDFNVIFNEQQYRVEVPFKCTWQEWQNLTTVPNDLVDSNEPNNGKNKLSSRFSNNGDWVIRCFAEVIVSQNGINTKYIHSTDDIRVLFYDKHDLDPPLFSTQIETFKEDGVTSTDGNILDNESTIIKATFTPNYGLTPGYPDLSEIYGIIRIEEELQPSFNIDEASTLRPDYINSRVIEAEKEVLVGGIFVITAKTDPSKLTNNVNYKISARLGRTEPVVLGAFDDSFDDSFDN